MIFWISSAKFNYKQDRCVANLVEHLLWEWKVQGSNPIDSNSGLLSFYIYTILILWFNLFCGHH